MTARTPIGWAYPFPVKAAAANGAPVDSYRRALAMAKNGFYPLNADGLWQGAVHFDEGSAELLDQSAVRCIADGEVVAYRIDGRYPSTRHGERQLLFSTGFVLVRHRLTLPTARTTLTFYSLYMHLLDWAGYEAAGAPAPPAFLDQSPAPPLDSVQVLPQPYPLAAGELIGHIGRYQDADDAQPRALLHLEVFTCDEVPAFLAASRALAERQTSQQKTLIQVQRGAAVIQAETADTRIPAELDIRLSSDSPSEGRWVRVQPYAVLKIDKAALGRYRPATKSYSLDTAQKRALALRLGVGVGEMPEQVDFLLQSYASPDSAPLPYRGDSPIPASHPLREIGIALQPPRWVERGAVDSQGRRAVSGALAAWTGFPLDPAADGPLSGEPRILPSAAWSDLAQAHKAIGPDGTRWWYLSLGGQDGQELAGWVAERAPFISRHSPWEWPGFSALPASTIDLAPEKPGLAQPLSQRISQQKSAWLWSAPSQPADGSIEQQRREALAWWQELAGQPALAADGLAWHFHPIGLIELLKKAARPLIWLKRVQERYGVALAERFREKVIAVGANLGIEPNHIMACIALETGRTFDPAIKNPQSSATGLIQFMDSTAKALGTTTERLARMDHIEQMDYVEKYFLMTAKNIGVPTSAWSLGDLYFSIFSPSGIKKQPDDPIYRKGQRAYAVNTFHDRNKDGVITKREIAENIHEYFNAGLAYQA